MPKVIERKAAKDYPNNGIKKGEKYFYWKVKTGPASGRVYRSKMRPTPSQLNTGFAGLIGEIEASLDAAEDVEGVRSVLEEIRELGEEQTEKHGNMPEGLQQGDTGQLLEERASQCEHGQATLSRRATPTTRRSARSTRPPTSGMKTMTRTKAKTPSKTSFDPSMVTILIGIPPAMTPSMS